MRALVKLAAMLAVAVVIGLVLRFMVLPAEIGHRQKRVSRKALIVPARVGRLG